MGSSIEYEIEYEYDDNTSGTFSITDTIIVLSTLLSDKGVDKDRLVRIEFPEHYKGVVVSDISNMFADCPKLTTVSMEGFSGTPILNCTDVFLNTNFLTNFFIDENLWTVISANNGETKIRKMTNIITVPNDYVHVNTYTYTDVWISSTLANNEQFSDQPLQHGTFYTTFSHEENPHAIYTGNDVYGYEIKDIIPGIHHIANSTIFDIDLTKFKNNSPHIAQILDASTKVEATIIESGKGYILTNTSVIDLYFGFNIANVHVDSTNNIYVDVNTNITQNNIYFIAFNLATTYENTFISNDFYQRIGFNRDVQNYTLNFDNWIKMTEYNTINADAVEFNKNYTFAISLIALDPNTLDPYSPIFHTFVYKKGYVMFANPNEIIYDISSFTNSENVDTVLAGSGTGTSFDDGFVSDTDYIALSSPDSRIISDDVSSELTNAESITISWYTGNDTNGGSTPLTNQTLVFAYYDEIPILPVPLGTMTLTTQGTLSTQIIDSNYGDWENLKNANYFAIYQENATSNIASYGIKSISLITKEHTDYTDYTYSMVKPTKSFATLSRSARKLRKYNAPTDNSVLTVPPGMCVVQVHDENMIENYETWLRSESESTVIFVNSENVELGFENI